MTDRPRPGARARRALERLRAQPLNFDRAELDARPGRWHHDERLQPLPAEPPGPPRADGSWAVARELMRGYEFADPSKVRAHYDPALPLEQRDLLLEVRFLGLAIRVGCRVTDVFERTQEEDGRAARVWGWSYATLEGHFEQGEMSWEVRKWEDTGAVDFRIRARSRASDDGNPFLRLGFRIFGRREQLRFYDSTCERLRRLTEQALEGRGASPGAIGPG